MQSPDTVFTLVAPESVMERLLDEVDIDGVEMGKRHPMDALADAADAPLGPEEIKLLLELVTVGFAAGASVAAFIKAIKDLLRKADEPTPPEIIIRDLKSDIVIARVNAQSDPDAVAEAIEAASNQ